jgi:hypothetical protein
MLTSSFWPSLEVSLSGSVQVGLTDEHDRTLDLRACLVSSEIMAVYDGRALDSTIGP